MWVVLSDCIFCSRKSAQKNYFVIPRNILPAANITQRTSACFLCMKMYFLDFFFFEMHLTILTIVLLSLKKINSLCSKLCQPIAFVFFNTGDGIKVHFGSHEQVHLMQYWQEYSLLSAKTNSPTSTEFFLCSRTYSSTTSPLTNSFWTRAMLALINVVAGA